MPALNGTLKTLAASMALVSLAACSGAQNRASGDKTAQCVELNEGTYFVVEDGRLVATSKPEAEVVTIETALAWPDQLEKTFPDMGFPWMGLNVRENIATLTGLAPDAASKERAFKNGEQAIFSHEKGKNQITLVVDGISVEGGEAGVGAALADLSEQSLTLAACQKAFNDTMQGRYVQFQTSRAELSRASTRLLDAVTGVATLCKAYNIEIAGHTDSRGDEAYNQDLSQRRAEAVKAYLVSRGVSADQLQAVGYGETRPLDPATTLAAFRKNRRTEFKVTERPG